MILSGRFDGFLDADTQASKIAEKDAGINVKPLRMEAGMSLAIRHLDDAGRAAIAVSS